MNNFRRLTNDGVVVWNVPMSTQEVPRASFPKEVMRRRKRLPSQLAADLGVSHVTVSWRLAEYSGVPVQKVQYAETREGKVVVVVSKCVLSFIYFAYTPLFK
ncbi:hypothetical protein ES703_115787 [subsurface metagenome]